MSEIENNLIARVRKAEADKVVLMVALESLLGDMPNVQGGICQHCGRDYIGEIIEGDCVSNDCSSNIARAAITQAKRES